MYYISQMLQGKTLLKVLLMMPFCFVIFLFKKSFIDSIFVLVYREEIWDKLPKDNRQVTLLVFR